MALFRPLMGMVARALWMVVFWLAAVGMAGAADSAVTELNTDRCKILAWETRDEAGAPLKKSERYASAWRCKGWGGRFVYIRYGDQREEIAFGTSRRASSAYMGHGHFGSWGPSVEWRGAKTRNGRLAAVAAIVPYRWDIRHDENAADRKVGGDLAVIRLGQGRNTTCIVAWVDTVANPDAMMLARRAADEPAANDVCASGRKPDYLGKRSDPDRR